jgi:hypothetical protein
MKLANLKSLTGRNKKIPKAFRVRELARIAEERAAARPLAVFEDQQVSEKVNVPSGYLTVCHGKIHHF